MVSHRRSAMERRAQKLPAEARTISRIVRACVEVSVHRGAKPGDSIHDLASFLLRHTLPREQRDAELQTDLGTTTEVATQTEIFETIPEQVPTDNAPVIAGLSAHDSDMTATVGVGAFRRKKKRQHKRNLPDDDALLDSVIASVTREREELESRAQAEVSTLESIAARKGMVCPEDHPVSVRVITNATSVRCFRCSSVRQLGDTWCCCIPCEFLVCWNCVETFAGGVSVARTDQPTAECQPVRPLRRKRAAREGDEDCFHIVQGRVDLDLT